jgi:hypothetical protein
MENNNQQVPYHNGVVYFIEKSNKNGEVTSHVTTVKNWEASWLGWWKRTTKAGQNHD